MPRILYRTIMVGIDPSPLSSVALASAFALAERVGAERLHLVRILEPLSPGWPAAPFDYGVSGFTTIWNAAVDASWREMARLETPATHATVSRKVRVGTPARDLAREAIDVDADLLVIASHDRRGLRRAVMGSVAGALLRIAHCPLMVVSTDRPGLSPFRSVLAAVDLSRISERVLKHAFRMADHHRGSVQVVSLNEAIEHREQRERAIATELGRMIERARERGVDAKLAVMSKAPAHNAILEIASLLRTDLVVVGTHRHSALHRLVLGATATHVTEYAPSPVLVVPHDSPELRASILAPEAP
jgi:nucleotide-binding universal stress UspA family protein